MTVTLNTLPLADAAADDDDEEEKFQTALERFSAGHRTTAVKDGTVEAQLYKELRDNRKGYEVSRFNGAYIYDMLIV